jgi:hypothetical protein
MGLEVRHLVTALATVVTACGPADRGPSFDPVADGQTATVGVEYDLPLRATDPERDPLTFTFSAPKPADLATRAHITDYGDGTAKFIWKNPNEADAALGTVAIDFSVTDGHTIVTQTVTIQITAPSNQKKKFVSPLGGGTVLDLTRMSCLDLAVMVQDPNVEHVTFTQDGIDGATLTPDGDFGASWHWCPTPDQIARADSVFTLFLSADDGLSTVYRIVLNKPSCPTGSPPTVSSSPSDVSTSGDVTLTAQASDDKGLAGPPVLYWSTTAPAMPVALSAMKPVPMTLTSGTLQSGTFSADVPNPAAAGATATLYYVVVATDADDPSGTCNHTTQSAVYHLAVTSPGGCVPDTSDNDPGTAHVVSFDPGGAYTLTGRSICTGDVDWFTLHLDEGQTLYVSLTFTQNDASQDLDLDIWAGSTDLTPCNDAIPCSPATGQSSDSNESYVHTAEAAADYFIEVLGYNGAQNHYDICISLTEGECPAYP